jgi:hypothetical protein
MVRKLTKRVELVPNWKKSWKWASNQISTIGLIFFSAIDVIQPLFSGLPRHILDQIPHGSGITITLFALNIVGRLFRLKPKEVDDGNS